MIGLVGHADLTAEAIGLVEDELSARLRGPEALPGPVLVRVGSGLPVACGRAAHRAGRPLAVLLPGEGSLPAPLPERERAAAGELLLLADQARLLEFDPGERDACVRADEQLIRSCRAVVAVWDGSASNGRDATAHLVAFARSHGIPVEVVWPSGAERSAGPGPAGEPGGMEAPGEARGARKAEPPVPAAREAFAPAAVPGAAAPANARSAGHRLASAADRTG